MKKRFELLFALLVVCLVPADAEALCGSDIVSRCLRYWNADAVFVGQVISIERRELRVRRDDGSEEAGGTGDDVRLEVIEAFRGVSGPVITVWNLHTGEAVDFKVGEKFFVYADVDAETGRLSVSGCDTRRLAESERDLEYARWIRTNPAGGRLGGSLHHSQWDPDRNESRGHPLPAGLTVTVAGEGRSWIAAVGKDGTFRLDVPLGTYDVTVNAPQPLVAERLGPFEIAPPGRCYERSIQLWWPGMIRGRVVDAEGRPVPACPVAIASSRFARQRPLDQIHQVVATDDRGEFVHDRLAPGEYLVGIHIDPDSREKGYPAFYYPGVTDVAESPGLKVTVESPVDAGDLRLPVAVEKIPLEGSVLWPDGSPAAEARVWLYSEDRAFDGPELLTTTDGNGHFHFRGMAGRRYDVSVSVEQDGRQFSGSAQAVARRRDERVVVRLKEEPF